MVVGTWKCNCRRFLFSSPLPFLFFFLHLQHTLVCCPLPPPHCSPLLPVAEPVHPGVPILLLWSHAKPWTRPAARPSRSAPKAPPRRMRDHHHHHHRRLFHHHHHHHHHRRRLFHHHHHHHHHRRRLFRLFHHHHHHRRHPPRLQQSRPLHHHHHHHHHRALKLMGCQRGRGNPVSSGLRRSIGRCPYP